ncbi:unnamed protein product [Urochloa humidicola]
MHGSLMASSATVTNISSADAFFQKLRCCYLPGWTVQFVLTEDSTSVSFSIEKGKGAKSITGRSKTEDESSRSVAPLPVMPNLKDLRFEIPVMALYKDGKGGCDNLGLECLPSLRSVKVSVDCEGASADDVEKAEGELRNAAQLHPSGPIIELERCNEDKMMGQSTHQEGEEPDQKEGDVSSAGAQEATTPGHPAVECKSVLLLLCMHILACSMHGRS